MVLPFSILFFFRFLSYFTSFKGWGLLLRRLPSRRALPIFLLAYSACVDFFFFSRFSRFVLLFLLIFILLGVEFILPVLRRFLNRRVLPILRRRTRRR